MRNKHKILGIFLLLSPCAVPVLAQCTAGRAFAPGRPIGILDANLSEMPVVADFNQDKFPDFAAHNAPYARSYEYGGKGTDPATIGIYLNDPARATSATVEFFPPQRLEVGEKASCYNCVDETDVQVADVNGDGAPDLVVSRSSNDAVYIFFNKNDHSGTFFTPPTRLPVGDDPVWVRAGDFDGDGILDLATVNLGRRLSPTPDLWSLTFLRGLPAPRGTFDPAATVDLAHPADDLGPTDKNTESPYEWRYTRIGVTSDLMGDLLVTSGGPVRLWRAVFNPALRREEFVQTGHHLPLEGDVAFGDFDGSGSAGAIGGSLTLAFDALRLAPDFTSLATANRDVANFLADNWETLGSPEHIRLHNVDGDKNLDVVAVLTRSVLIGFGDGTRKTHPFESLTAGATQVYILPIFRRFASYRPAVAADFNHDGFVDILGEPDSFFAPARQLTIYLNLGLAATQGGTPHIEVIAPSASRRGTTVHVSGTGLHDPQPVFAAVQRRPGGIWVTPLPPGTVIDDRNLSLPISIQLPVGTLQVSVLNACHESNALSFTVAP